MKKRFSVRVICFNVKKFEKRALGKKGLDYLSGSATDTGGESSTVSIGYSVPL